jgi:hypothetical protein
MGEGRGAVFLESGGTGDVNPFISGRASRLGGGGGGVVGSPLSIGSVLAIQRVVTIVVKMDDRVRDYRGVTARK